jgi:hypothetical protein
MASETRCYLTYPLPRQCAEARDNHCAPKRGQQGQALGRSRGGFSTKIHLKTDFDGHLIAFDLTSGEKADAPHFPILLAAPMSIRERRWATRAMRERPTGRPLVSAAPFPSFRTRPMKGKAGSLRNGDLQGSRPNRTSRRQAKTLQADRTTLRENQTKLRFLRRTCRCRVEPGP